MMPILLNQLAVMAFDDERTLGRMNSEIRRFEVLHIEIDENSLGLVLDLKRLADLIQLLCRNDLFEQWR